MILPILVSIAFFKANVVTARLMRKVPDISLDALWELDAFPLGERTVNPTGSDAVEFKPNLFIRQGVIEITSTKVFLHLHKSVI